MGSSAVDLAGVLVGGVSDQFEEHLGERPPLELEALDGAGGAGGVERRLRPLDERAVAVGDAEADGARRYRRAP